MDAIRAEVTGSSARTLSELSKLIGKRQKWLRESSDDAVIATAIDVIVSIRTLTRSAKNKRGTKPVIEECPGLVAGYEGGRKNPRRTLRLASGGGMFAARRVKWLTSGLKRKEQKVYLVRPEHDTVRSYYVVASSAATAKAFEDKAAVRRMRRYGNLAKWAFGVAMNKLSTKGVRDAVTGEANLAGSRLSKVLKAKVGSIFAVKIEDSLDYALDALRGGRSSIDQAIMKAANKIAGRLKQKFGDALGADFRTPFPEVKRRAK